MELNKLIRAKKKARGLYFYKGHDKVKESQPTCPKKLVFYTVVANIHIISSNMLINLHVEFNVCTCDKP